MAKKSTNIPSLSFRDIVLGAEAEIIRQALEARQQIDQLAEERRLAYERIAQLETQIEDILGETGSFPFPAPPLPVAGLDPKADIVVRTAAHIRKQEEISASDSLDEEEHPSADENTADETEE